MRQSPNSVGGKNPCNDPLVYRHHKCSEAKSTADLLLALVVLFSRQVPAQAQGYRHLLFVGMSV